MAEATTAASSQSTPRGAGILPAQAIRELIATGEIAAADADCEADLLAQVQPASLDLQLGSVAYRVRASFLPGKGRAVAELVDDLSMHRIDLTAGAVLEVGCVYIVPLMERLTLSSRIAGIANPKSSTGRLNVFTRLICDGATSFDKVPEGYEGPLYAEIAPNAFSILVQRGTALNQLRLIRGSPGVRDAALARLHAEVGLIGDEAEAVIDRGLMFTVDLTGRAGGLGSEGLIGFRAKRHADVIDVARIGHYDPREFWDPISASRGNRLILDPNEFYILASSEAVRIPPTHAAEMVAYDVQVGEFRVHYAGFFDPGFGWEAESLIQDKGTRAVLEVRSHEVPFMLEDGQPVGRLVYDRLVAPPDQLYGAGIGSSYHAQGLTLSKHFQPWSE
ncbi:2'-deoxycytidine 5'-triphosphate deaminase [Algihabitans albus]|uniref:2'-deoxycytidine 5'-triphosphate deaminase n=1 Tax=Algihabitans albus TaxID=2164067 RepID=UPI000E5D7BC0|nr:2'-deoxycytidine 5'-triphosphate deaminase [Algihabitans albus]